MGWIEDAIEHSVALGRGLVRCGNCGRERKVDSATCLRFGWPKCCGYTMQLVSEPEKGDTQ